MKRIVIVGNGFDLAAGASTRYSDFYKWWMNAAFEKIKYGNECVDEELFVIRKNVKIAYSFDVLNKLNIFENNSYVKYFRNYSFAGEGKTIETINWLPNEQIHIHINDKLFDVLSSKDSWTDIEKAYFDLLVALFKDENYHSQIDQLNASFEIIKGKFIEYIKSLEPLTKLNEKLLSKLESLINFESLYSLYEHGYKERAISRFTEDKTADLIFLNFNYTDILNQYLSKFDKKLHPHIIPIHGSVYDIKNLVFGYGDEKNKFHKEIEELDNDDFLKHFKSNYYGGGKHYDEAMYYVHNYEFDVVVIGHSLGLSDRVLLNTIFEHKNCRAIHLFHTGGDSHFRKRIALSRHFDDKHKLRDRLMMENEHLMIDRIEKDKGD